MVRQPDLPGDTDTLPDPIEWPRLPGAQRSFMTVIAAATLLGLVSALLVGWTLQTWEAAAIYGALIMSAAAVGYVSALGRARRGGGRVDWALVRSALSSRSDALAITDGGGRLLSANDAYGTRCGGYPSPFDIAEPETEAHAIIAGLAVQARRDGNAQAEVEIAAGPRARRLRIACRPAEASRKYLLWTLRRTAEDRVFDEAVAMLEGPFGIVLSSGGLMAVLTGRDGEILAANGAFRSAVGGDRSSGNLGQILAPQPGGLHGLQRDDGTIEAVRLIELPLPGESASDAEAYLFVLLPGTGPATGDAGNDSIPALLSALPLGLALVDRDGRFVFVNAAFEATVGIGESDRPVYPTELVVDEDKSLVSDAVRRAAGGHGKARDLRVRLTVRPDEQAVLTVGRATGFGEANVVLSVRDNREQLKLERQVAQATKMQAVGQLAGGVAHDFNNILTAVIGYCDLMLMRHSPGDADFDDINQIRQNANRAANLVRQLLAFSRQQTLRPQILQVSDVIGELSHLLKRLLGETITLSVRHGRNLGAVRADPGQLEQVIVNLAVNARDAMADGGTLDIVTYPVAADEVARLGYDMMPAADYVAMSVTDSGTGIPADIIGKIFEPFFTTKEFGKGTGLGLSTVYGIVKQTGGFIFAANEASGGARFTIYLPVCQDMARPDTVPAVATLSAADLWGKGTILLVEDEAMVRAVAERALSRKGYDLLTAGNGEEALELLDARPQGVDLLITDVVMPTMDGPTLVRHARERFPTLRIIFMSGYAEEQLRRSINVPGVAFLPKPFSVQELGDAVRTMLAGAPESTGKPD